MGTTAQKLEYLATTKTKIKDSINLTGAGITTEPFRQYAVKLKDAYVDIINNGTDTLYNNFPKVSGSGTDLTLQNTYEAPMRSTLKGNTSQVQLSGKNKIDLSNLTISSSTGITGTIDKSLLTLNGTPTTSGSIISSSTTGIVLQQGTYTYSITKISGSYNISNGEVAFYIRNNSNNDIISTIKLTQLTTSQTFTINANTELRVQVYTNTTNVSFSNCAFGFQIEQGTATTYEQYCGGTPSPNPSYPQDIHNVSGNNSVSIYDNLKDSNNILNAYMNSVEGVHNNNNNRTTFIPIEDNKTYTIKKVLSARFRIGFTNTLPKNDVPVFEYVNNDTNDSYTITNTTYKYLCVWYWNNSDTLTEQQIFDSLIISSDTTTYPINLGTIELCKIGTYQDYIYKEDDKWYLHKEIGKIDSYNGETITTDFISTTGQKTTGATIYYVLATPTNTEITDTTLLSQLEAIYNAKSKNGTTNINQVNNDLPFIITASALEKGQ